MSFMQIETLHDQWFVIDVRGSTDLIPASVTGALPLPEGVTFDDDTPITQDAIVDALRDKGMNEEPAAVFASNVWHDIFVHFRDYVSEGVGTLRKPDDLQEVSVKTAWGARYSAPGYLDCTDWVMGDTEEEAVAECKEMYGNDDDENEDNEDEDEKKFLQPESDVTVDGIRTTVFVVDVQRETAPDDPEQLADIAIDMALEDALDYVIPAEWSAEKIDDDEKFDTVTFRVTRWSKV